MKHIFLLAAALWCLAEQVQGQNFRPFRPGRMAEYTRSSGTNDTTMVVEMLRGGRAYAVNDSIYDLNPRLARAQQSFCTGCPLYKGSDNVLTGRVGLYNQQTMHPTYGLSSRVGGSLSQQTIVTLQPRAPIGQPWPTDAGTAQVTARRLGVVLGQPDSLVDIDLYDGIRHLTLRLSKTFGLVQTYPMAEILNDAQRTTVPAPYVLRALPQLGLGATTMGARAVYDFQVGDVFLYQYLANDPMGPTPLSRIDYHYGDSVLARTNSSTSDAVTYQMLRRSWATGNLVVSTYSVTYSSATSLPYRHPTGGVYMDSSSGRQLQFLPAVASGPYRRAVQKLVQFNPCGTTGVCMAPTAIDIGYRIYFGAGLGMTSRQTENWYPNSTSLTLVAYRKGAEQVGNLAPWYRGVLSARNVRPAASTAAYPQPCGASLTVAFALARPQPVALVLRDALGRAVLARPAQALGAGPGRLVLDTHALPAGIYLAQLSFEGEGRSEVIKVVKSE